MAGLWSLHEDADQLTTAAESWSGVSESLVSAGDLVDSRSRSVRDAGWEGETAESYDAHRRTLVADIDTAQALAGRIAATLSTAAGSVRVAQGNLDFAWAGVASIPHRGSPSGDIVFETRTEEEAARVRAAVERAREIRHELDRQLADDIRALESAEREWRRISSTWAAVAGGADAFEVPSDGDRVGVITEGGRTIFNTGGGNDEVTVFIDPVTGEQIVVVNGTVHRVPAYQEIVIRGGEGNDRIGVPKGVDVDITILGSEGDDAIHGGDGDDRLYGLDGHDYVDAGTGSDLASGGADRDYLDGQDGDDTLSGGEGNDTVYGLDGNDTVSGDAGDDFLEGGTCDDTLHGGAGGDAVSGGTDDDTMYGGSGDDVTYAGRGDDTAHGGSGTDTSHSEDGDDNTGSERVVTVEIKGVPDFIRIEGSPEFQDRVRADLELLAASPRGQQMLGDFQATYDDSGFLGLGRSGLTIAEFPDNSNSSAERSGEKINYSPRIDWIEEGPPLVVLFHEMAHAYDFRHDQFDDRIYQGEDPHDHGDPNGERVAVGLPIDHDDDPSTPEIIAPNHSFDLTENGLREELGVRRRPHY